MRTYDADVNGHRMHIAMPWFSGSEIILCDNALVSDQRSLSFVTPHEFVLQEEGQEAKYDVRVGGIWGFVVRRNSRLVYEHHRGFLRFFSSFGLIIIAIGILLFLLRLAAFAAPDALAAAEEAVGFWQIPIAFIGAFPLSWWLKSRIRGK